MSTFRILPVAIEGNNMAYIQNIQLTKLENAKQGFRTFHNPYFHDKDYSG